MRQLRTTVPTRHPMKHADHHHQHQHAHTHPPKNDSGGQSQSSRLGVPSLLLASTAQRLYGVLMLLGLLWLAVAWALNP